MVQLLLSDPMQFVQKGVHLKKLHVLKHPVQMIVFSCHKAIK